MLQVSNKGVRIVEGSAVRGCVLRTSTWTPCVFAACQVDELEKKHKLKEGEAGILRDKLEGVERVLLEERRSKALENSKLKEEKSQKEMDLEKKVSIAAEFCCAKCSDT